MAWRQIFRADVAGIESPQRDRLYTSAGADLLEQSSVLTPASIMEYDFDVGRAVASIVVNGVMFRYPNIRFITVHSGGTVPMLVGRMKDRIPNGAEKYLPNGLCAEVRKWYFDVAHATFPWPMAALRA